MKTKGIGICLLLIAAVFICAGFSTQVAFADTNPTILLDYKPSETEIVVDVLLRGNEGIFAMQLVLQYDREKLRLVGFEKGEALSSLNLMTTNVDGPYGYSVNPFILNWVAETKNNDASNGKLLTLRFVPASEDLEGKANVTFSYTRDCDVTYVDDNGEPETRNLLVDTLHIDLSKGKVTEVENEIEYNEPTPEKNNTGLVVGVTVGTVALMGVAIALPIFWRKKFR